MATAGVPGEPPEAQSFGTTMKLLVGVPREDRLFCQQLPSPWSSHQWSMPLCFFLPSGVMPKTFWRVRLKCEVSCCLVGSYSSRRTEGTQNCMVP